MTPIEEKSHRLRELAKQIAALANEIVQDTGSAVGSSTQLTAGIPIIQRVVCDAYGVPLDTMTKRSRLACDAEPRMVAMWLCRLLTRNDDRMISKAFARERSTVSHAFKAIETRATVDATYAKRVITIRAAAQRALDNHDCPLFSVIKT
jgi:chromosomal replication initiator protein